MDGRSDCTRQHSAGAGDPEVGVDLPSAGLSPQWHATVRTVFAEMEGTVPITHRVFVAYLRGCHDRTRMNRGRSPTP